MDNFDLRKYLAEDRLLKEEMELDFFNNDEEVALIASSGEYEAEIENGKVSFSVVYEDEDDRDGMEFDEDNWKSILGPNHAFVEIASKIPTEVEAIDDYVMITVNLEDLKGIASLAEGRLLKEDNSSDYELIVSLLGKLAGLAEKNIGNSDNFDLEDMSQVIEGYYDEMKELGGFEKYDDEDDLEDFE